MDYKKILVVDDDELVRTLLEETLLQDGYTVRTAMNAEETTAFPAEPASLVKPS